MNKYKFILGVFFLILFVLFSYFFSWWVFGSLKEFSAWYPSLGKITWFLKSIVLIIIGSFFILFLYSNSAKFSFLKNFSIFLIFVLLSWLIGEQHPFSRLPMYHSFPNYAYVFYFLDTNNVVIPTKNISNLEAPELSHLYFSILKKGGVNNYGNLVEDSILDKDFGENMFQNISWKNQGKNRNCVKIQLLNISIENNLFVDENKTIYDSCY